MKTIKMKNANFFKLKYLVIAALFLLFGITSCDDDDDKDNNTETETVCVETFGYNADAIDGPSNWDNYCVPEGTVNECGSVERQSPINIVGAVGDSTLTDLNVLYTESSTDIINNGHTIEFKYNGDASSFAFNNETYSLLQFHFHAASEHTVDDSRYPLEVHLVHKSNTSGNIAVIGVFFEEGDENEFLAQFSENLPLNKDDVYTDASLNYNANAMVDVSGDYYNYAGSLTTPPCSEIVEWVVMENPLQASQAQLDKFASLLNGNFRPVQPLNDRVIKLKD